MSVRKYGVKLGLTATAAAGLALGALAPAMASTYSSAASQGDYTYKNVAPAATDVVGVGSDTIQFVDADLASAYNSIHPAGPHLASYGACTTPTAGAMTPCTNDKGNITVGGVSFVRPDGSGTGMKTLYGATDQPTVAFARSSSTLDDAGVAAGLVAYPFAQDSVVMVTAKSTHAPASLSIADIVKIYNGTYTHWNEIPGNASGSTEAILPLKPQSGSGTLKFFDAQLKAANGNTDADTAGVDTVGGVAVQEHDPSLINGNPNAIAPFSLGRAGFNADKVSVEAGWRADRAVFNVLRSKDAGNTGKADKPAWFAGSPQMDSIFGETGFFCSPMARPIIEKAGFSQLKSVADGGKCGVGITTTSAPTLSVYNTATYTTTWVPAPTGPSEDCTDATTAATAAQSAYNAAAAKVAPAQAKATAATKAVTSARSALTAANAKVASATKTVNAKKAAVAKAKKAVKKAKHKSRKVKAKAKKQLTKANRALRAANAALTTAKRAQATANSTYAAAVKASTAATNAYHSVVKDRDTKKAVLTAANSAKDAACAA